MAAAAIGAAVAGSTISIAGTLGASLGAAKIQSDTAKSTNTQNIDFQKSLIDRGEKSFTDKGLPSFLYWGGSGATQPNSLIHLGGQNFYEQSGVNSNLPYFTGTPYSQWNHVGTPKIQQQRPSPSANQASEGGIGSSGRFSSTDSGSSTNGQSFIRGATTSFTVGANRYSGQLDKTGLGAGRYSAVPPPLNEYNAAGTQTMRPQTGDRYAQTILRGPNNKIWINPEKY